MGNYYCRIFKCIYIYLSQNANNYSEFVTCLYYSAPNKRPFIPVQLLQTCLNLTFQSEIRNLRRLPNWDQITFCTGNVHVNWAESYNAGNSKCQNTAEFSNAFIFISLKMQTTIVSLWHVFTIQLQIKDPLFQCNYCRHALI